MSRRRARAGRWKRFLGKGRSPEGEEPEHRPIVFGDPPSPSPIPLLDALPDDELRRLNALLPWTAFTVDSKGRRLGDQFSAEKRATPQEIPDPRIVEWDRRLGLKGKSVLEVGCFEGIHTIALCQRGAEVVAIDARVENVVKTLARCALYDVYPRVFRWDLEDPPPEAVPLPDHFFGVHHVGVLYHLEDPLRHLQALAGRIERGMMLDTHVAPPHEELETYGSGGQEARCWAFREGPREDPFSGMRSSARWLAEDCLLRILGELGFGAVEVAERRAERNGPRLLVFAER